MREYYNILFGDPGLKPTEIGKRIVKLEPGKIGERIARFQNGKEAPADLERVILHAIACEDDISMNLGEDLDVAEGEAENFSYDALKRYYASKKSSKLELTAKLVEIDKEQNQGKPELTHLRVAYELFVARKGKRNPSKRVVALLAELMRREKFDGNIEQEDTRHLKSSSYGEEGVDEYPLWSEEPPMSGEEEYKPEKGRLYRHVRRHFLCYINHEEIDLSKTGYVNIFTLRDLLIANYFPNDKRPVGWTLEGMSIRKEEHISSVKEKTVCMPALRKRGITEWLRRKEVKKFFNKRTKGGIKEDAGFYYLELNGKILVEFLKTFFVRVDVSNIEEDENVPKPSGLVGEDGRTIKRVKEICQGYMPKDAHLFK